jgi:hypothetical protein
LLNNRSSFSQVELSRRAFGAAGAQTILPRPAGTIASIARVMQGLAGQRLSILVMTRCQQGLSLRCPIGLLVGAVYRLQIGTQDSDSVNIRITSSRTRHDGSYDVGAIELQSAAEFHAAAA